jgi:microsomal dipeptidase-like Zn-dependent dipeptidase
LTVLIFYLIIFLAQQPKGGKYPMKSHERISSLHDDVRVPLQDRDLPEYDVYPRRFSDVGKQGERSVLRRLFQFGVTEEDLTAAGIGDLRDLTDGQYEELLGRAVGEQFSVVFANAFEHWERVSGSSEQWAAIEETSVMVSSWHRPFGIGLIRRGSSVKEDGSSALVSLEGLHLLEEAENPGTNDVIAVVDRLFSVGVRSVGIQYGMETKLATLDSGLTALGEEAVRQLLAKGILVDLAHAVPRTRSDILRLAEDVGCGNRVVYTHGAPSLEIAKDPSFGHIAERRGITEEEIRRIIRLGGIIGLGVTRPFFQTPKHVAETFDRLAQLEGGPQSLALGTDFGGVSPALGIGMMTPTEVAACLGDLMTKQFGAGGEASVRGILRENARVWLQKNLP